MSHPMEYQHSPLPSALNSGVLREIHSFVGIGWHNSGHWLPLAGNLCWDLHLSLLWYSSETADNLAEGNNIIILH